MIGHEWAVELLRAHVVQGETRHAYLFTGPQGVGRRTLALRLAQALNCPQPLEPGEPCLTCRTCIQIDRMQHPDLAIVQSEQRGGVLRVDQVRELQRYLATTPYEAQNKVAVILRFEEANASAANALLKTLEEPASRVVMILTAESAELLLPTIVSRCEMVRLRTLPIEQVKDGLQMHWNIPVDQAGMLASISGGRPGYARYLFQNSDQLAQRQAWLDDHSRLLAASIVERFSYAETLAKEKDKLQDILSTWLSLWRDVLLRAADSVAIPSNPDRRDEIAALAQKYGLQRSKAMVASLEQTRQRIEHNVNTRLTLEVLMLELPRLP